MADDITLILQTLQQNQTIRDTRFSSSFLNNVAEMIVQQRGLGGAQVFVGQRIESGDAQLQNQARVLNQEVFPVLKDLPRLERRVHIVAGIVKMLPTLQNKEFKL